MENLEKKMIKIGIDCHKLEDATGAARAGIGRHIYKLLEEVSKREELQEDYRFYLYFKGQVPQNIPFLDNPIFVKKVAKLPFFMPFFRPSFNIFFHIALPLYTIKDRVDVTFFASFMLPALFIKKSVVVLTNDIYWEFTQGNLPFKYRLGYKLFATWAALRATAITTQTHASKAEISQYFKIKPQKITVVSLGADMEQFKPQDSVGKKDYILYLGQAFPRRHLRETLLAFEIIALDFPDLDFIAVGTDKYNPPIIDSLVEEINGRLGKQRIKHIESVEDQQLKQLYQKANIFTYISSSEAMGLPPLEALAAGTVPVVADTPTTNEIFEDYALFVRDPADPQNIAEVLKVGLSDKDVQARILAGQDYVLNKYTWKLHTDKMMMLFNDAIMK